MLWLLTEERPKKEVIAAILDRINQDRIADIKFDEDKIRVKPVIENGIFQFDYIVEGSDQKISLYTVEDVQGSFLDYLVFYQSDKPRDIDSPIYAIEETKTNPSESRNVAVYQRLTKFVFLDMFDNMKNCKKIMLYNIRTRYKTIPATFVLGVKAMKTMNIEIIGYNVHEKRYDKFKDLDDLIKCKNDIATKRSDNTPIKIESKLNYDVCITGKLEKSGGLGHDPNIGAITSLCKLVIILEPQVKKITIQQHNLTQEMITNRNNKFLKIADHFNLKLDGLKRTKVSMGNKYWKYSKTGEKIVSILFHLILEYNQIKVIYENHAGCEQGYFEYSNGKLESIKKTMGKPDIIFLRRNEKRIYLIEAEKSDNMFKPNKGISQLESFQEIEDSYCSRYDEYYCVRYAICYGDQISQAVLDSNEKILFQLTTSGRVMFSKHCPDWIIQCFRKLNVDKK